MRNRSFRIASHEIGHYLLAQHHGVNSAYVVLLRTSRTRNPHLWRSRARNKDDDIDICLAGWAAEALFCSGEERLRRIPFFVALWVCRYGAGIDRRDVARLDPNLNALKMYRRLYKLAKLISEDLKRFRRLRYLLYENQFMNHDFLEAAYNDEKISLDLYQRNRADKVSATFLHELEAAGLSKFFTGL